MPGDGSAEWGNDLDPKYIPHSWDPDKGYLVTANADPIGVSDDNEPFFTEPMVDGAPLYTAWEFVDGARAGRITKRIKEFVDGGKKLTLDDMQSIQADSISEHGQALNPVLLAAMTAMGEELAKPGAHPDISDLVKKAPVAVVNQLNYMVALAKAWTFATPSATDDEMPSTTQIGDSQATLLFQTWVARFMELTFDDEIAIVGLHPGTSDLIKTLAVACNSPDKLSSGKSSAGDPIVFDDINTEAVETKQAIAVRAFIDTIQMLLAKVNADPMKWRWGNVHTLTLDFFLAPLGPLKIPLQSDPKYPTGFPRKGASETVDPGGPIPTSSGGFYNFTYAHGPGIRFVADMDPAGPRARNVIPGGEVFDPVSPHYKDQMELWRKNQSFDLAFQEADVVKTAMTEYTTRQIGRIRFAPK
jgi:penicillin amidase